MAYCRCDGTTSEVYMYASISGGWEFHVPSKGLNFVTYTLKETLFKLRELRDRGLKIPDSAFERLEGEYLDFIQEQQTESKDGEP